MTGGLIGGAIALGFWSVTFTGVERRFPGFFGSTGLLTLIALCLWFDGWIAAGLIAFCVSFSGLLALGGGGRGPRRAGPRTTHSPAPTPGRSDRCLRAAPSRPFRRDGRWGRDLPRTHDFFRTHDASHHAASQQQDQTHDPHHHRSFLRRRFRGRPVAGGPR